MVLILTAVAPGAAPREQSRAVDALAWHDDYTVAYSEAKSAGKMLLIYFCKEGRNRARRRFESTSLSHPEIRNRLTRYVLAKLPLSATVTVVGKPIRLLDDPSFAMLRGRQGVAIIDLSDGSRQHGFVVSQFPFPQGRWLRRDHFSVVLDLPLGSLTQRTLIYAVRTHPDRPAGTRGRLNSILAAEAASHSRYQARTGLLGHHRWEERFHRINARLPRGLMAQEVCAESWPGQDILEAARDCVNSWRQSPGHWDALSRRHPMFGCDMKLGRNGIWYATGLFATSD